MTPKVYFTSFCTSGGETIPQKLARLLLSAEDADCIFRQTLTELHIGQISPDATVAFERVLVGIQGLDAAAQRELAAFVLTHSVSDADEDAVGAYLAGMIGNTGGCEMRTFQPA